MESGTMINLALAVGVIVVLVWVSILAYAMRGTEEMAHKGLTSAGNDTLEAPATKEKEDPYDCVEDDQGNERQGGSICGRKTAGGV